MRLRPQPLQLAVGSIAVGMTVFLAGVTVAWQSSTVSSVVRTEPGPAVEVAAAFDIVEPGVVTPVAEPLATVPTAVDPTTTDAPATTAAPPATKPPTTAKPKAKAAVKAVATTKPRATSSATAPFAGMGTWVDVFDWSPSYAKGQPIKLGPGAVDAMADNGVQVLYIQTTRADYTGGGDIVDPPVLQQWLARADARGMKVVAWYLPTLTDVGADLRRLRATAALGSIDGIGIDIESKAVVDHDERSRRLVELSRLTRAALAGVPLSAVTLPNVVTDVINLDYWPRFPWAALRPFYDVWQPMSYWTNRKSDSPYRNAELYTRENIERMRNSLGDPNAVVHPIGGIGDRTTVGDIQGFVRAMRQTGSIGGSLYDWSTQSTSSYAPMREIRS